MPKTTPLNAVHRAAGARMVDFGGWDMPVHYGSQIEEHHAVRRDAGMFDVSHMRVLDLTGPDARAFLRYALANDVDKLKVPGKALYSCMLAENGGVLDDLIVYAHGADRYRIVVNAATAAKDVAWLAALIARQAARVDLAERNDLAMIAVQGPNARARAWQALPEIEHATAPLKPFTGIDVATRRCELFVGRTGYTGEDGFEVMLPSPCAEEVWGALSAAGVRPCGLGARDTLRLEVCYPLHGNDIGPDTDAMSAGLGWVCALDTEFTGVEELRRIKEQGPERKLVAFVMQDPGIARQGMAIEEGGEVTSGSHSPMLDRGIGMGYVPAARTEPGTTLTIDVRGKPRRADVVKKPIYKKEE